MNRDPRSVFEWSIDDIIEIVGRWSEKALGLKPIRAKLIDVWHLLSGLRWNRIDDLPSKDHPGQLTPGLTCKLFFGVEDVRAERYYRYADFHETIEVDKALRMRRVDESKLDGLVPKTGHLEFMEEEIKQLKEHVDEMIDMFIIPVNVANQGRRQAFTKT